MKRSKRMHDPQWLSVMTGQRMGMCTNCSQWWLAPRKFRFKQIMQANCLRAPPSRRQWTCLPPPLVNVFSNSCVINPAQGEPGTCMKKLLHMLHVKIVIFPHQILGLASEMVNFYGLAGENSCYICEKMFHMLHMLQTMLHDLHVIFPYQIPGLAGEMVSLLNFYGLAGENICYICYVCVTYVTYVKRFKRMLHMLHVIFPNQIPGLAGEMVNFYGLAGENPVKIHVTFVNVTFVKNVTRHIMSYLHIKSLDWSVNFYGLAGDVIMINYESYFLFFCICTVHGGGVHNTIKTWKNSGIVYCWGGAYWVSNTLLRG